MPVDTSMYNAPMPDNNPLDEAAKLMQLKKQLTQQPAQTMANKIVGGMPGTQAALQQLGAGQSYNPAMAVTDTNQ